MVHRAEQPENGQRFTQKVCWIQQVPDTADPMGQQDLPFLSKEHSSLNDPFDFFHTSLLIDTFLQHYARVI